MKFQLWIMLLLATVSFMLQTSSVQADATPWRPVAVKASRVMVQPVNKSVTIWKGKTTPKDVRPVQRNDSKPDPMDGSQLPDDLFGGTADPRDPSGSRGGSQNCPGGNCDPGITCFKLPY